MLNFQALLTVFMKQMQYNELIIKTVAKQGGRGTWALQPILRLF